MATKDCHPGRGFAVPHHPASRSPRRGARRPAILDVAAREHSKTLLVFLTTIHSLMVRGLMSWRRRMTRNVSQALAGDRGVGSTQMHHYFLPTRSSSSLPDTYDARPPTLNQVPRPIPSTTTPDTSPVPGDICPSDPHRCAHRLSGGSRCHELERFLVVGFVRNHLLHRGPFQTPYSPCDGSPRGPRLLVLALCDRGLLAPIRHQERTRVTP
ncbi:hypothetical protein K466DRAFT_590446 [Polyporus arcularius HHB13444]|uniref:Uncharacterized protein n=1 Tax=Polyporus arcularius HHB13444 TaxID=1314778 RepID=A0A5C3NZS8_9APHY|nr:hypothetical protein K466DRAFT_590446 [Polyporus arcularius HHB13444]